jgi:hypothetical protein
VHLLSNDGLVTEEQVPSISEVEELCPRDVVCTANCILGGREPVVIRSDHQRRRRDGFRRVSLHVWVRDIQVVERATFPRTKRERVTMHSKPGRLAHGDALHAAHARGSPSENKSKPIRTFLSRSGSRARHSSVWRCFRANARPRRRRYRSREALFAPSRTVESQSCCARP